MVKRVATTLVAVAMGAAALVTAAPAFADDEPAYAPDPKILSIDVSPNPVVVKKHGSVEVTATVRTKDLASLSIEVWEPQGGDHGDGHGDGHHWLAAKTGDEPYTGPKFDTKSQSWSFDWSHKTGLWKVHVEGVGPKGEKVSADRGFVVKHEEWAPKPQPKPHGPKATRIAGFDATPEPVRKGHKLTLKGSLQVAQCYGDWYYKWDGYVSVHGRDGYCDEDRNVWHDWHWLGSQDVDVYFLPKGSHSWKRVGTIETNDDGSFAAKVRAFRSGTWGVKFDGTRRLKGSEATDYVKVVRH